MDHNQNNPSSSNQEGMLPMSQIEKLFQMFQHNFNIAQALAAIAPPPPTYTENPASVPVQNPVPTDGKATLASELISETVAEENPTAEVRGELADVDERVGVDERAEEDEGAEVAPSMVEEELALIDTEGVERVRTRMASEDVKVSVNNERMKKVMAEIEAEIREGRAPTIEGRMETGVVEGEIFDVSNTDEDEVRPITMDEAQMLSACRLRRKYLMEESDDEVQPPRVVDKVQEVVAEPQTIVIRRRKRKIFTDEPEEDEDDEVLRLWPEASCRPTEQAAQFSPAAELEKKRKGKQPALPPTKKHKKSTSSVMIVERQPEPKATPAIDLDEEEAYREMRSKAGEDFTAAPVYPVMKFTITRHSLERMLKFEDQKLEEECKK